MALDAATTLAAFTVKNPDAELFHEQVGKVVERLSALGQLHVYGEMVDILAEQANMSARHFSRSFAAETGVSPSRAVERLRVEVAKARVQASAEPIERIADVAGFGDAERMRQRCPVRIRAVDFRGVLGVNMPMDSIYDCVE